MPFRHAVVDSETTGLDARIHQAYEVAILLPEDLPDTDPGSVADAVLTIPLPHNLCYAESQALTIGRYHERGYRPWGDQHGLDTAASTLLSSLAGRTVIGSNPDFDARFLERVVGFRPWSHRAINTAVYAQAVFDLDDPIGVAEVIRRLNDRGHEVPLPDHTAAGDVESTWLAYLALRHERRAMVHV